MKLKSILKTLSIDQLREIESHWEIAPADLDKAKTDGKKQDLLIANLYQRLQSRSAWEIAVRGLTDAEMGLIHFLVIHGGDLEKSEVRRRYFDGDEKRLLDMVGGLARRGIVFLDEVPGLRSPLTLVGVPEPFLRFIDLPSFWEGYLGHFLKEHSNNELKHIATQGLRLQPESANKNYLIYLIRTALLDPKFLRRYLDQLPEGPSAVFQSLVERNGACVYRDLLELNIQRRYDHSRGDALQWLLNTSGLAFTAVPGGNKYNNLLMVPRDVMYVISNHFTEDNRSFRQLDSVTVVEKEKAPSTILDNSTTLLRDMVVFANFVDAHPVRVLATGGIGKNDLKKILPAISRHKTVKYVEFLSVFMIEKKFLVSTGETYRVSHTFLKWLEDSQAAYADLLAWWLKTASWNEEFVEGNTVHTEPKPTGLVSIVPFRRLVLEVLSEMPRDRWCLEEGFHEELLPKIAQDIPRRGDAFFYDKFTRSNELVTESIVAECLSWLGLVAIGLPSEREAELIGMRQGDGKTMKARGGSRGRPRKQKQFHFTFRFTDLGRFVFSRALDNWERLFEKENENEVTPLNFDVQSFIVQPTHEIMVPPDLELRAFYHLVQFCEVKSIDVMSLLVVTKDSLREGLDAGLTGEEIMDFLKQHSRTPVPDSMRYLIEECARKHGEVNMGHAGGFIVVDDELVLNQMQANRKIAPAIKKVLPGGVVILASDVDVKKLSREMQRIGFMPRLESEHVHIVDDERYNFSLTREDTVKLIAAVQMVLNMKDEKGREFAHDRMGPLLERLKSDQRSYSAIADLAEPLVQTWTKTLEDARQDEIEKVRREYDTRISHLMTNSVPRNTSKFTFDGPNPAKKPEDVHRMMDFAIEHEFEVEIDYTKANKDQVTETIAPESLERDRLYAHCRTRDAYSVYRMDRILACRLV